MADDVRPITAVDAGPVYIQWGPIFAGALAAAALAFVLNAFAGALGIAVGSASPTWRDASIALWILTGLYLVLVALVSYGLGGYVAGRARVALVGRTAEELEFRDGLHGALTWAVATLITGLLVFAAAQSLTRIATPTPHQAVSTAGENIIAYDLDRLFRNDRQAGDITYSRGEASRILMMSSGHSGVPAEDRTYLIRLVSARTGLSPADAERRVDAAITAARDNIGRARKSATILGFMAAAAALLGLAAAWFAACAGGRHRDVGVPAALAPYMRIVRN
jgi:hypothetical protein